MLEASDIMVDTPTTWLPLPPTPTQAAALTRFALHTDELTLALQTWRAQAKGCAHLLPQATPYPGALASSLLPAADHPLRALLPASIESVWLKCDGGLPFSKSLSDRGVSLSVLTLISDAMIAAGLAHVGQPLKAVDQAAARTWLGGHQLMICGPGRDVIVAGLICSAFGLGAKVIRRSDTPQALLDLMHQVGLQLTDPMTRIGVDLMKRHARVSNSPVWWLDTTESFVAFKGYACAALELKQQIFLQGIRPSRQRPLMVFITSSNCLGAAGVVRGLKSVFGPYVKTILVEDTHQLQALPTLCRWPKDPEEDRFVAYSEMGTHALVGVVDAAITVDEEHRKHAMAHLPVAKRTPQCSDTVNLFTAAGEYLRHREGIQPYVVLWQSESELN